MIINEFYKNALTLMTGTAIAQAIPIAISPILTRLYSPEDFGVFAVFVAVTSVLSVISTGRYEQVVMLPQSDEDAANIVILSLFISVVLSLILFMIVMIWNDSITGILGNPEISNWLYLIPFSVLSMSAYNTFNYWLNRQKSFKNISATKIAQGSVTATGQFVFGYYGTGHTGLIGSYIVGWLIAFFLAVKLFKYKLYKIRLSTIMAQAKLYKNYPSTSAPGSLLDCATGQAPVFFITKGYEAATVGFFSLAGRVLFAPAIFIGLAIGQVFFQKISSLMHGDRKQILSEVISTSKQLAIVALVIFIPFMMFGEELFALIFGDKWRIAGSYVVILSPAFFIRFIVSPLSTVLMATGNVRLCALWQTLHFFSTIIVMSCLIKYSVNMFLVGYVINDIVMYILYFYLIINASKQELTTR